VRSQGSWHRRRVQACQHRGSSSNTGIRTNHEQGRDGHCREFFGSHNRFDCNRQQAANPAASLTSNAENVAAAPVNPWDTLRVSSYVIAKYPDESVGWWPAIITAIDKRDFIIRWPDEPRTIPSKIKRKHVAIIRPDLDVSGK
jgi:hypothetical protein